MLYSGSLLFIFCIVVCVWRRQWRPTPVLLPGKRSLVGCSPWGLEESDTTEWLHFHFSLSCIGEGNGSPLQCSYLENPRDREAWWAAIYGVAQSWTRLKWLSSSSSSHHGHQNWFAPAPFKLLKQLRSCDLISSFVKQLKNISFHTQHLSYGLIVMI